VRNIESKGLAVTVYQGVFCDLFSFCLGSLFNGKNYYFFNYKVFQIFLVKFADKESNMKLKRRNRVIMVVVIMGVIVLLLQQASRIRINSNPRNIEHLSYNNAEFNKNWEDGCFKVLYALANRMGDYETIKAEERRDRYDELLKSTLEAESQMVLLFTVWKPNAIDGMDKLFIGRKGSSPTGQYAMTYSKENCVVVKRESADIEGFMTYVTGPDARKARIDNPILQKINGNDKFTIRMMVPIINNNNDEVVGVLGCLLVVDVIQKVLENTIQTNNEIALMIVCSEDGTILAHFKPEQIGRNILDVDAEFGDSRREIIEAMKSGKPYNGLEYDLFLDDNIRFIMKPIKLGNSNLNLTALIGISESSLLKKIRNITGFIVIITAIAALVTMAVIFIVLGFFTRPVKTVTGKLKGISGKKINMKVNRASGISAKNKENTDQLVREAPLVKAA
jgi:methyl-accepting chemotaxis protein